MYKVAFNDVSLRYQISKTNSSQNRAGKFVTAAQNVSFELLEGDRLGVIGRNGSGKSTLLSLSAGNILPESGSITVRGDKLALINRSSGLVSKATLKENITLKGYAYKIVGSKLDQFTQSVLSDSGLLDRENSPLNTLSTGMRGRFNIALNSQIVKPITILDEWIGTLNISGNDGNDMLNKLSREAKIVMLASHNEMLIRQLCNRVLLMEQGRIFYDGSDFDAGFVMLSSILEIDPKGKMSPDDILSVLKLQTEKRNIRQTRGSLANKLIIEKKETREKTREARQIERGSRLKEQQVRLEKRKKAREAREIESESRLKEQQVRLEKRKKAREAREIEIQNRLKEREAKSLSKKSNLLLQETEAKITREPLHFINIGRNFIPSIKKSLRSCEISNYKPIFHPISNRLADIPKGEKICLIYRDPISRFISGFYSRKLQGAPDFNVPWTQQEASTFKYFETPSDLLESFADKNSTRTSAALAAVRETQFLNMSLCWYFKDVEAILARQDDIALLANCEDSDELITNLESLFNCKLDSSVFNEEERFVLKDSQPLTDTAIEVFHQSFGYEYELFGFLESLAQQTKSSKQSC